MNLLLDLLALLERDRQNTFVASTSYQRPEQLPSCNSPILICIDNQPCSGLGHFFRSLSIAERLCRHSATPYLCFSSRITPDQIQIAERLFNLSLLSAPLLEAFTVSSHDGLRLLVDDYPLASSIFLTNNGLPDGVHLYVFDDENVFHRQHNCTIIRSSPGPFSRLDGIISGTALIPLRTAFYDFKKPSNTTSLPLNILVYLTSSTKFATIQTTLVNQLRSSLNHNMFCIKTLGDFESSTTAIADPLPAYLWSDIVIGSCGISFWERSLLGVPSILYRLAPNQHTVYDTIKQLDLAFFADENLLPTTSLVSLLNGLSSKPELIDRCSRRLLNYTSVIDGSAIISELLFQ